MGETRYLTRIVCLLGAVLTMLLALFFSPIAAADAPSEGQSPVVVLMTGEITWDTFDPARAPATASLAAEGTMANLVPVSTRGASCPLDSWLALSAGRQASPVALSTSLLCGQPIVIPSQRLSHWSDYQEMIAASQSSAQLGTLSEVLSEAGVHSQPIGTGAAYVLADRQGVVPANYLYAPKSNDALADVVASSVLDYDITFVDARTTSFTTLAQWLGGKIGLQPADPQEESTSPTIAELNSDRVESIVGALPHGTRVLIVSLNDAGAARHMQTVIAGDIGGASTMGPAVGYSDSVRQRGVIQLSDLTPTFVSWLGIDPPSTVGQTPMTAIASGTLGGACSTSESCFTGRFDELTNQGVHASAMRLIRGEFIRYLTWGAVVYFLVSLVLLARRPYRFLEKRPVMRTLWIGAGVTVAAVPLASLLMNALPWWATSLARLVLIGGSWLLAAGIAAVSLWARRFHAAAPLLLVSALTAAALVLDAATGSRLMADSPVGFNLLTAARFYGVGNEAFALLATGSLTVLAFLGMWLRDKSGKRWVPTLVVGVVGLWIAAVDALPSMGADFGGVLSFVPALLLLLLFIGRVRLSVVRVLVIGGVTAAAAVGIAVVDWMRPPGARTHLGKFVQSIIDGELFDVIGRKLGTNIRLLMGSTHRWVVLAAVALFVVALLYALRRRPLDGNLQGKLRHVRAKTWGWMAPREDEDRLPLIEQMPALKPAMIANMVCMLLAFALNDSGIVLSGMAAILFIPLLQALIVDDQEKRV